VAHRAIIGENGSPALLSADEACRRPGRPGSCPDVGKEGKEGGPLRAGGLDGEEKAQKPGAKVLQGD